MAALRNATTESALHVFKTFSTNAIVRKFKSSYFVTKRNLVAVKFAKSNCNVDISAKKFAIYLVNALLANKTF